jgi:membrane-associated phospholipid phosphatase
MWEREFLLWLHAHSSPWLDRAFLVTQPLGTTFFFLVTVVVAAVWHFMRKQKNEATAWVGVGVCALLLKILIKAYIARPRPALWLPLVQAAGWAMPSGHALGAAAFYPLLAWTLIGRRSRRKIVPLTISVLFALVVGIGRLYLGVHWPTDVLVGWAIGFALAALAIVWLQRRESMPQVDIPSPPHLSPLSILPLPKLGRTSAPLILDSDTILLSFGMGVAGGVGILSTGIVSGLEPITRPSSPTALTLWVVILVFTFITTGLFAYKQIGYYLRSGGTGKEGIFVDTVGMVNRREEAVDATLCYLGGLLFAVSLMPFAWLFVLAIYSSTVAVRAWLVRRRERYSDRVEGHGIHVPALYRQLKCYHNGYWVPAVMLGWMYLHSGMALAAAGAGILLYWFATRNPLGDSLVFVLCVRLVVGVALLVGAVRLSKASYITGLRKSRPPT